MKKFLTAALAVSVLASAGVASAQPYQRGYDHRAPSYQSHDRYDRYDRRDYRGGRFEQQRHFRRGERLPSAYRGRAYVVDHRRYGLRAPPRGYQYSRVNGDIVLAAIATGLIASVILGQ